MTHPFVPGVRVAIDRADGFEQAFVCKVFDSGLFEIDAMVAVRWKAWSFNDSWRAYPAYKGTGRRNTLLLWDEVNGPEIFRAGERAAILAVWRECRGLFNRGHPLPHHTLDGLQNVLAALKALEPETEETPDVEPARRTG